MQVTGGLGYYSASSDSGGVDQSFSGTTIPTSLLLGGSMMENLVIGGGLFIDYASSPTYEQNGTEVQGDFKQYVVGLGIFGDYYLDPKKGGVHIQGFLGWGGVETSTEGGGVGGSDPTGLVVYGGGGYEWWISDEWSAGVMGRLTYGNFSINDVSLPTIAPAVVGTLTLH
jgi:hypothetical protein